MSTEKNVIDNWYATRDVDAYIDDDIDFEVMEGFPLSGLHKGREAVHTLFSRYPDIYSEFEFKPEQVIDGDTAVVGLGRYRGVLRANGAPFNVAVCHVWDVRNGKIVRLRHYVNTHLMQKAASQ